MLHVFTVNLYKSRANVGKVCCIHGAFGYNLQWETKIRIYTIKKTSKSHQYLTGSYRRKGRVEMLANAGSFPSMSPLSEGWGAKCLPRINRSDWLVILLYPTFTSLISLDPLAWKCWWFLDHMFMTKHHPAQLILTLMSQWFSMVEGLRLRISWLAIYIVQLTSKH